MRVIFLVGRTSAGKSTLAVRYLAHTKNPTISWDAVRTALGFEVTWRANTSKAVYAGIQEAILGHWHNQADEVLIETTGQNGHAAKLVEWVKAQPFLQCWVIEVVVSNEERERREQTRGDRAPVKDYPLKVTPNTRITGGMLAFLELTDAIAKAPCGA